MVVICFLGSMGGKRVKTRVHGARGKRKLKQARAGKNEGA